MIRFKKHPARGARIMAGWITASIAVITSAAVLEDSVENVDYSTALIPQQAATQGDDLDLSGSATPAEGTVQQGTTNSSAVTNTPAAPATETPAAPATESPQAEEVPAAPPTTAATPKARKSRAS